MAPLSPGQLLSQHVNEQALMVDFFPDFELEYNMYI